MDAIQGVGKIGQIIAPIGTTKFNTIYKDLASISGMLISGTTGSGKTVFVQSLIVEMMRQYTPNDLRFIIYDSKRIDYVNFYNSLYSLFPKVMSIFDLPKVLSWLRAEIEKRYEHITEINSMPHIFLILDDCGSFISSKGYTFEDIVEILQKARQVKIHCWMVTSTPTNDMSSIELRANIPTRVAFHVTSKSLSKTILGFEGAEMLCMPGELIFGQGVSLTKCNSYYLEDDKIDAILREIEIRWPRDELDNLYSSVRMWMEQYERKSYDDMNGRDFLFAEAGRNIIVNDKASIGMLQRTLKIGFNRAAHIMDQLLEYGVVGPEEGTKPRKILMTLEEFEALLQGNYVPSKKENQSQIQRETPAKPMPKVDVTRRSIQLIKKLTPHEYIKGDQLAIGINYDRVYVCENDQANPFFVVEGGSIERLCCSKAGVFSKGAIIIGSTDDKAARIFFSKKRAKEFYELIEQLSADTGVAVEYL